MIRDLTVLSDEELAQLRRETLADVNYASDEFNRILCEQGQRYSRHFGTPSEDVPDDSRERTAEENVRYALRRLNPDFHEYDVSWEAFNRIVDALRTADGYLEGLDEYGARKGDEGARATRRIIAKALA